MKTIKYITLVLIILATWSCKEKEAKFDATGTFETTEIIISSEANGKIIMFNLEEGEEVKTGQKLMQIDTTSLSLQKAQIVAKIASLGKKKNDATPQINILKSQSKIADQKIQTLNTQMSVLSKEQRRIQKLYKAQAATEQQLDNINGKITILAQQISSAKTQKEIISTQIESAKKSIAIVNRGIGSEKAPLLSQINIINDKINKAAITNQLSGTILNKYVEYGEFVNIGKPLLKIGNLSEMILKAYITGDQLGQVKTGQHVDIYVDSNVGEHKKYNGIISWISAEAEFTPKTIQTKNERANLVYAFKMMVKNDGLIKIGMYGEVNLNNTNEE